MKKGRRHLVLRAADTARRREVAGQRHVERVKAARTCGARARARTSRQAGGHAKVQACERPRQRRTCRAAAVASAARAGGGGAHAAQAPSRENPILRDADFLLTWPARRAPRLL